MPYGRSPATPPQLVLREGNLAIAFPRGAARDLVTGSHLGFHLLGPPTHVDPAILTERHCAVVERLVAPPDAS
jgi:hypothetical protein